MSDMFKDIRERIDKKPRWIGERVWEGLKAYWSSPEFKGKSALNTANRHSDVGGFTHTGGSINANESKRRLVRTCYFEHWILRFQFVPIELSNIMFFVPGSRYET
jgi:hypothetical protein